jgi:hypothetical protein
MSSTSDPSLTHYDDTNRAFLQALLARGSVTLSEGQKILSSIFSCADGAPAQATRADFESYVAAAASVLSVYDYEIRSSQHQVTKERIWAVVNSISDGVTQLATARTPDEMAYIRRLLDAMFDVYNTRRREVMAVTSMQALEKRVIKGEAGGGGLTHEQAERLLGVLESEGWLERSKEGWYSLTPRALMELRAWLVEMYNDEEEEEGGWQRIKFCEACKEIVTVGQRCMNLDCNVRLHDICQAAFWNSRPEKKCPRCETAWEGKAFVGQRVITTTEDYLKGKRRSGGVRTSRQAEDEEVVVAVDEEEAEDDE